MAELVRQRKGALSRPVGSRRTDDPQGPRRAPDLRASERVFAVGAQSRGAHPAALARAGHRARAVLPARPGLSHRRIAARGAIRRRRLPQERPALSGRQLRRQSPHCQGCPGARNQKRRRPRPGRLGLAPRPGRRHCAHSRNQTPGLSRAEPRSPPIDADAVRNGATRPGGSSRIHLGTPATRPACWRKSIAERSTLPGGIFGRPRTIEEG